MTRFRNINKTPRQSKRARVNAVALGAALTLSLSVLPGANAQQASKSAAGLPPLGKERALQLPKIVQQTLPNGLKLVVLEDHTQPAVWMRLAIPAGSIRDPKDKVGLASMTARLLNKGTTTRSETEIADTIDGLGASLGAGVDDDYLTVSASGLSPYADTLFSLLADITLRPSFPEQELDRTRSQTVNELTQSLSQPATIAELALARLVYGAHPYGNNSEGTPQTLQSLTRDDVQKFHDTFFAPNQSTLFLVGDITPAQAMEKAQTAFGSWDKKDVPAAPAPPAKMTAPSDTAKPQITILDRPGAAQTEVRIGTLTNGYSDPNRIAGTVATAVLGLGQFDSRLTREIRVKRGLTYSVGSGFRRNKDAGEFEIFTFTKNASTGEVVKLALEESRKIGVGEVPGEELQDRKAFLQGSFAVSVATPNGVLTRLVPAVLYGNGPDDLTHYAERVQAVTGSQVPEIMRGLHLNAPQIVLVGDANAIRKDVEAIGTVRVIPAASVDLLSPTLEGKREKEKGESGMGAQAGGAKGTPAEMAAGKTGLAATIKAHGGAAFLNWKSMVLKGSGELTDPTGQFPGALPIESLTLTLAAPDKVRADLTSAFPISFGTAGGNSEEWLTVAGAAQTPPAGLGSALNPIKLLRDAYANNYAVRSLPKSGNSGDTGYIITTDKGADVRVYIDPATNLASRMVLPTSKADVTVLMGDYKTSQGVKVPGTLKVSQGKATLLDLKFTDVAVNAPVDNAIFAKPKQP